MSDQKMSAADILEQFRKIDAGAKIDGPYLVLGDCHYHIETSFVRPIAERIKRLSTIQQPTTISSLIAKRAADVTELVRDLDHPQRRAVFDFAQFALDEEEHAAG